MNKTEEKVLRAVLKAYSSGKEPIYLRAWFLFLGWMVLVAVLVVVKRLLESGELNYSIATFIFLFAGVLIGYFAVCKVGYRNRPFVKPFIDLMAIKRKLEDA